jgi:ubiquinone/menaquinone biosynthesis C-methylase UbiE|tara:strand:- start:63 stop:671 length:609 start_codon:yes stop_codon:yes gene_type:complete
MSEIRLNLGCASRLLSGYINVDLDSIEEIKNRYPNIEIDEDQQFLQANILDLPFEDNTVDEIRADAFMEHMSFKEESQMFKEVYRALKPGGLFVFSVPDFEDAVRKWLAAEEDWRDFYRDDDEAIAQSHWFGQYSYSTSSRWGYLTAAIFGPQNSPGQFHKNAYTEGKIIAICDKIGFEKPEIDRFLWKGDRDTMIRVRVKK